MARTGALAVKVRLFAGDDPAFGPGRADLLEAIAREGSISAAGRSLGMSYRYAWDLVADMNRRFRAPLVEASPGGVRGGGARPTDLGREVLASYRRLEAQIMRCAQGDALRDLTGLLEQSLKDD